MTTQRNLQAFVTATQQTPEFGIMPAGTWIKQVFCHVLEAFDSNGTDQITVGWDSDPDALCTTIDVSTTGLKTVTLGVSAGYNSTAQKLYAFYSNGGSEPTTGKAFLWVDSIRVPLS
jgi:hypothetical protein